MSELGLQLAQLERAKGELRALWATIYCPPGSLGHEYYLEVKQFIEDFIEELDSKCG